MARKCTTCAHPDRAEIDRGLVAGQSAIQLGRSYGLNPDAISRHRKSHLGAPAAKPAPAPKSKPRPSSTPVSPEKLAEELEAFVRDQLERVRDENLAISEYDRTKGAKAAIEALGKVTQLRGSSLDISNAKLVRLPAFRRCTDALLASLKQYPMALRAAAEALAKLAAEGAS